MKKASDIVLRAGLIFLIAMYGFLTVINLAGTTHIDTSLNSYHEYAYFAKDNILITVLLAVVFFGIFFCVDRWIGLQKINTSFLRASSTAFIFVTGVIWVLLVKAEPISDQQIVYSIAKDFNSGNYEAMTGDGYITYYPFQLGIVLIFQALIKITHIDSARFFMLLNVLLITGTFNVLFCVLKKMTRDVKVLNVYWLLAAGCLPAIFYSVFVYGTIIGLFFSCCGMLFLFCYKEKQKIYCFLLSFICFVISVAAKSNYQIFVIAAALALLWFALRQKKKLVPVLLSCLLALTVLTPKIITACCEAGSGIDPGSGVPANAYIAMGLMDGNKENGCGAAGWYNQQNLIIFGQAGKDSGKASAIGKQQIAQRFREFAGNPRSMASFAFEKISTQWSEPTFQTFWMTQAIGNHGQWNAFTNSFMTGNIRLVLDKYMKIYLLMIWAGCFVYFLTQWKRPDAWMLLLGIITAGGFIFHLFWEGKALYIMPYFVISIVPASYGITRLLQKIRRS